MTCLLVRKSHRQVHPSTYSLVHQQSKLKVRSNIAEEGAEPLTWIFFSWLGFLINKKISLCSNCNFNEQSPFIKLLLGTWLCTGEASYNQFFCGTLWYLIFPIFQIGSLSFFSIFKKFSFQSDETRRQFRDSSRTRGNRACETARNRV